MRYLLVLCLLVTGCAAGQSVQKELAKIGDFAIADLQAADADAVAHNDIVSHACYPVLIKYVQAAQTQGNNLSAPIGVFSAQQKLRDLKGQAPMGIPPDLKVGCAGLLQDDIAFAAAIAAMAGGVPPIGLLPGLPAIPGLP